MKFWKTLIGKEIIKFGIFASVLWIVLNYVVGIHFVPTSSMEPTINANDVILTFRGAYLFGGPERGDIITFTHEEPIMYGEGVKKLLVKRVIGLPGDKISFRDKKVYINNVLLYEDYLPEGTVTTSYDESFQVPEGHYFVLGDNRENSFDSREWLNGSYVSEKDIEAKLFFVIPISNIKNKGED